MTETNRDLQNRFDEMRVQLEDTMAENKKLKDEKRVNFIRAIKSFGDKYSDEELEAKELIELETIMDAARRFGANEEVNTEIIPMATKMDKNTKVGIERIDFSMAFADVNEAFNMSNFEKIKTGK